MKHNKNHDNTQSTRPQLIPVRFEFSHPTAITVCIAGTFNDWNPTSKPMHSSGAGNWWKETGLMPGTYEYCLVVDVNGCPTRTPEKRWLTRLAEKTQFSRWPARPGQLISPTQLICP